MQKRLIVSDNGLRLLIDSGADISILSKFFANKADSPAKFKLFPANESVIDTFGERLMTLDLGLRKPIKWIFTIADVPQPIIGADLISKFGLLIDIKGKKMIDSYTNLSSSATLSKSSALRSQQSAINIVTKNCWRNFTISPHLGSSAGGQIMTSFIISSQPDRNKQKRNLNS